MTAPGCPHPDTWADPAVCPAPCGLLHARCGVCHAPLQPCPWETKVTAPYEIQLPWTAPPLSLNHRMHWRRKAAITAQIRSDTCTLAKAARIGACPRIEVTLHYQPRDKRVRDAENPTPTLKAICDGLVDAGIVPDDDPGHMVKHMPVIHPADKALKPRMWLVVHPLFVDLEEAAS